MSLPIFSSFPSRVYYPFGGLPPHSPPLFRTSGKAPSQPATVDGLTNALSKVVAEAVAIACTYAFDSVRSFVIAHKIWEPKPSPQVRQVFLNHGREMSLQAADEATDLLRRSHPTMPTKKLQEYHRNVFLVNQECNQEMADLCTQKFMEMDYKSSLYGQPCNCGFFFNPGYWKRW